MERRFQILSICVLSICVLAHGSTDQLHSRALKASDIIPTAGSVVLTNGNGDVLATGGTHCLETYSCRGQLQLFHLTLVSSYGSFSQARVPQT